MIGTGTGAWINVSQSLQTMALNDKHTRRIIKLLADILVDACEYATELAVSILRSVMDECARKLCRQCSALAIFTGRRWRCLQGLKNRRCLAKLASQGPPSTG